MLPRYVIPYFLGFGDRRGAYISSIIDAIVIQLVHSMLRFLPKIKLEIINI